MTRHAVLASAAAPLRFLKTGTGLWTVLVVSFWLALWWSIVAVFNISPDFLPTPAQVVVHLGDLVTRSIGEGPLHVHVLASLWRFIGGFTLAVVVGLPLGFLMGHFRYFDWAINPIFEVVRYIPPIAWAPFAILWFGANFGAQAFVIFISTLPPILINAYRAMQSVDPNLLKAARTLGASNRTIILEVGLPSSIPVLVGGLRIGVATGWMALIAAEIVAGAGSRAGLGYLILVGQQTLQASITIGAMLMIGILGWLFDHLLRRLEQRVMRWR